MEYKVIEGRMPEKVFEFFKALNQIPRGSRNEKAASDFCVAFAKERNLEWYQDEMSNVIIRKPATEGFEHAPVTMLQGHLDMVCQADDGVVHDWFKDPVEMKAVGDELRAVGTTLGADDGIAVAIALAILDSEDIPHPELECVFTSGEEIGMVGASALDFSKLRSKYLLNLDSEVEGEFLAGCAGGRRDNVTIPVSREKVQGVTIRIIPNGLTGGHSGTDIHRGRACATVMIGRILVDLKDAVPELRLLDAESGLVDNAISRTAKMQVVVPADKVSALLEAVKAEEAHLQDEFHVTDPSLVLLAEVLEEGQVNALDAASTEKAAYYLFGSPQGVVAMSQDLPDQVESSINLGIVRVNENEMTCAYLMRSAKNHSKLVMHRKLSAYASLFGGSIDTTTNYPAWEYLAVSPLRDLLVSVYEEQTGKKASVMNIHAAVECGLFTSSVKGLDAVSFGPDIKDIHSPSEALSISSTDRLWKLVLEVLKRIK